MPFLGKGPLSRVRLSLHFAESKGVVIGNENVGVKKVERVMKGLMVISPERPCDHLFNVDSKNISSVRVGFVARKWPNLRSETELA